MNERELVKVAGSSSLAKDLSTGVVINTNEEEIRLARKRKEIRLQEKADREQMTSEVSDLKSEIAELKALIKAMAEK